MRTLPWTLTTLVAGVVCLPAALPAQTPDRDPSSTLEQVLPPAVAAQVLARIADARSRQLPAAALEHRALELQAKGMPPAEIPNAIAQAEEAMAKGREALVAGGRAHPSDDEVEAGGEVVAQGVDGATVSSLAKSAPSGRSLAVPLAVLGALVDRGLTADDALSQVVTRLQAHASDEQLATLPDRAAAGQSHKPPTSGEDLAATKRPDHAGPPSSVPAGTDRPVSVPANGGQGVRPTSPPAPSTPSPRGRP